MTKTLILGLVTAAAVAGAALPASAQSWGGGDYWGSWRYPPRQAFTDYPEFRGEVAHIRSEIREGVNEGWLDDGDARQLGWRLQQVRTREASEFRFHGWQLPEDDRQQIRQQLNALDRAIDQARDESGGYGDN